MTRLRCVIAIWGAFLLGMAGCTQQGAEPKKGEGINIEFPGGSVRVGEEGVDVKAPGVGVKVEPNGAKVDAEGSGFKLQLNGNSGEGK